MIDCRGQQDLTVNQRAEQESVRIVLVGSFNPAIFHPGWFARQQLVPDSDAERAQIKVIARELAAFDLGDLFSIEVEGERFIAASTQAPGYLPLRDLVVGTFTLLRHTPVRFVGINITGHFRIDTEEAWHALGHELAPKEVWRECLDEPGLKSLSIRGNRPDRYPGAVNVKVEPSVVVRPGLFVSLNDHFELVGPQDAGAAVALIGEQFEPAFERYEKVTTSILARVKT